MGGTEGVFYSMIKTISFSISRLNNPEFSAFIGNFLKLLSASDLASLGMTQQDVAAIEAEAKRLTDQVYTTTGSEHTASMQAADLARDTIFKRIRLKLQAVEVAEEGSELLKLADKVRVNFLSKYGANIPQKAYQEETAILKGFLLDLNDKLTEDEQEMLGVTGDIMKLEKANNDFQKAYHDRTGERAEGDTGLTAQLRTSLGNLYDRAMLTIVYLANGSDEAKATASTTFVKNLNVILSDAKKRLEQRTGTGGSGSGNGSGNGEEDEKPTGGSGANTGTGSGSGSGGNTSGNGATGSGSGSNTGSGNTDYNDHDGIAEW